MTLICANPNVDTWICTEYSQPKERVQDNKFILLQPLQRRVGNVYSVMNVTYAAFRSLSSFVRIVEFRINQ